MDRIQHFVELMKSDLDWASRWKYLWLRLGVFHWDRGKDRRKTQPVTLKLQSGEMIQLRPATTDGLVFQELFIEKHYSRALDALNISDVRSSGPMRVVDLGANIGVAAAVFASRFQTVEILCVEPDADNFGLLGVNLRALRFRKSVTMRVFVGGWPGRAVLDDPGIGEWGFRMSREFRATGDMLAVCTLAELLDSQAWDEADLVKCDIEGAEVEVSDHARTWITRVRNMIVETDQPIERLLAPLRAINHGTQLLFLDERGGTRIAGLRF